MEFIQVLILFFWNLILGLPSIIVHGSQNIYLKYTAKSRIQVSSQEKTLIVLIHGRNGHSTNFNPLIGALKTGSRILPIELGSNSTLSVYDEVELVKEQLEPYINSVEHIILIGLSKGGVTAVLFQSMYPNKIFKVITISSPLKGTKVANYHPTCLKTRSELGYKSNLAKHIKSTANVSILFSIVPTYDHIIIPTSSTSLKGSTSHVYRGLYSHAGILHSPRVLNKVLEWVYSN